jgi:hypothetical protein
MGCPQWVGWYGTLAISLYLGRSHQFLKGSVPKTKQGCHCNLLPKWDIPFPLLSIQNLKHLIYLKQQDKDCSLPSLQQAIER